MNRILGSRLGRVGLVLLILLLVAAIVSYVAVRASGSDETVELIVNDAGDDYASEGTRACSSGSENCTLRAAIEEANGDGRPNTISFDLPDGEDTIVLTQYGTLEIEDDVEEDRDLSIEGPEDLTINGSGTAPVFTISGEDSFVSGTPDAEPEVVISGLTITGGGSLLGAGVTNEYANLTLRDVVIQGNSAEGAGGGIHNYMGNVTVEDGEISGNSAPNTGGGIVNQGGEITLQDTSVNDNESGRYGGGGIYNDPSGRLLFYGGELKDNEATSEETMAEKASGGGIYNSGRSSFYQVEVSGNRSGYGGGGIFNDGTVNLSQSSVLNNSSGLGGGIETSGGLISDESTIASNFAERGSGIYSDTSLTEFDEVLVRRSTVYGNEGSAAIFNARGRTTFVSSTIAGNEGGVAATADQFTRTIFERSIIAGNDGPDIERVFGEESDAVVSRGYNIAGTGSGVDSFDAETDETDLSATEVFGGEPALANNGGPTQTVAISVGSRAIDAVPGLENCKLLPLNSATDQRAALYVESEGGDGLCDIGAFEYDSKPAELSVDLKGPKDASLTEDLTYVATVRNAPDAGTASEVSLILELDPASTLDAAFTSESCEGVICEVRKFVTGEGDPLKVDLTASPHTGCTGISDVSCPVADLGPGDQRTVEVTFSPVEGSPESSFSIRARASTLNDSGYPESRSIKTALRE